MGTKMSNLTYAMVLVRQVSRCSVTLDGFDDHCCSQDDDNDLGDEDHQRRTVASKEVLAASERRRKYLPKHRCSLSQFAAKHNLLGKIPTLQIFIAFSIMSVFQVIVTLITVTNASHALVVMLSSALRLLSIGISRDVKVPKAKHCRNPPNSQINLKMIGPLKSKDPCPGQHRVATTRPDSMFSASCKTASPILPFKTVIYFALSSYICHAGFFRPFQCPSPVGMIFESLFSSCSALPRARRLPFQSFWLLSLSTPPAETSSPLQTLLPTSSWTCLILCLMVAASFVTSDSLPPGCNPSSGRISL